MEAAVGAVERGEEAVALEPDDPPVVMGHEPLDEQMMVAQQLLPALWTELRRDRRRRPRCR